MEPASKPRQGKHRYQSVIEGCEMAAEYRRSGLHMAEFARQKGISRRMVEYWTLRERELAATSEGGFVEVSVGDHPGPAGALPAPAATVASATPIAISPPGVERTALEIRFRNGTTIIVRCDCDATLLRSVIATLEAAC